LRLLRGIVGRELLVVCGAHLSRSFVVGFAC
jgi:hypothetical protein